jgi:hypothetical protein
MSGTQDTGDRWRHQSPVPPIPGAVRVRVRAGIRD